MLQARPARSATACGLHPFSTRRYLAEVSIARIAEGLAKRQSRRASNIEVIAGGYGFIATGRDAAGRRPRERAICALPHRLLLLDARLLGRAAPARHGMARREAQSAIRARTAGARWPSRSPRTRSTCSPSLPTTPDLPRAIEKRYGGLVDTMLAADRADEDPEQLGEMRARDPAHTEPVPRLQESLVLTGRSASGSFGNAAVGTARGRARVLPAGVLLRAAVRRFRRRGDQGRAAGGRSRPLGPRL